MARLTLNEVLASIFDSGDDNDDFSYLDSESEEEEDEEVSAYTCQKECLHCKNCGVLCPPNEQHTIGVISH